MPNYNNQYMLPSANNYGFPTAMQAPQQPMPQSMQPNPFMQMPQQSTMPGAQFPADMMGGQVSRMAWVEGNIGAIACPINRGETVVMFDTTPGANKFWVKSSDPYSGRTTPIEPYVYMKAPETQELSAQAAPVDMNKYVSREEYDKLQNELADVKKFIDQLK